MGCRANPEGITVQLCDRHGNAEGPPIFGKHVVFYGRTRDQITKKQPLTADEERCPGSDDWLTVIAVADSDAKLVSMFREFDLEPDSVPYTSCSSHRVCLAIHVGEFGPVLLKNRITLARGPILQFPDGRFEVRVEDVTVRADGAVMHKDHRHYHEFHHGSNYLRDFIESAKKEALVAKAATEG